MIDIIGSRYVLISEGARPGGQSTVRKGTDQRDGSLVAVKLLSGVRDEILQKIFERETTILKSLNHPSIIRLRDAGVEGDGTFYLVFDWIERSFADTLTEGSSSYEWPELADTIARPLLNALAHAHLKQAEHRDIKPGNILLRDDGTPVLVDFGISKLRSDISHSELTVANFRSRPYAPPEEDAAIPFVRDVYSMGVVLIQALHNEKLRDFADIAPALNAVRVPAPVRRLLESCVHHNRKQRPLNGSVLLEEFERATRAAASHGLAETPTIHLRLTNKVRAQLVDASAAQDTRMADAAVDRDLSAEVFAQFRVDRETGKIDRETVLIVGNSWQFTLKAGNDRSVSVIAAKKYDFEALEGIRKRALPVGSIADWTCRPARKPATAAGAVDTLQRALDDFEEWKFEDHAGGKYADDGVFDKWLRLLQAQEEVARGDLRPLRYSDHIRRGREADFTLVSNLSADLLGAEMEIIIEESAKWLARGEVVAQGEGELTLRSDRPLPRLPSSGLLTPFLGPTQSSLQRQRDAVSAAKDGTGARPDLSSIILDPSTITGPVPVKVTDWHHRIDSSKQRAVEAALGAKDLLLVQGPPGTGKTTLIAETVGQLVERNPHARILIVSQTHLAVDNALEKLDAAGLSRIVRLGSLDDAKVSAPVRHLLLDNQMNRWAASLRKRADSFIANQASAAGVQPDHLRAALALQQLVAVDRQIDATKKKISETAGSSNGAAHDPDTMFETSTPQEKLDRLTQLRAGLLLDAQRHLAGDLTLHPAMSTADAQASIEVLLGKTGAGPDLLRVLTLQADWLQRVASDENLAATFLQTSNVIAGTCIGFLHHPAVRDLDIDLCILDEASKATATEALVPMARAKRWVLIGDMSQLPPMDEELLRKPRILNEYDLEADFISETLFQRIANDIPDHSNFVLDEQYRMIRPIGDLISWCFYKGELHSPRTEALRGYDLLGKAVMWIDTKLLGKDRREDQPAGGGTSFANRAEASIVIRRLEVIEGAIERGVLGDRDSNNKLTVLLIAPYQLQVEEMKRRLSSVRLPHLSVDVQSVDAVQGREADLAIFSVTRSNPAGNMGFIGQDFWRRINVAPSRARFGLTIVGDADFARNSPGALRRVLRYIEETPQDCELRSTDRA